VEAVADVHEEMKQELRRSEDGDAA
jgi:hypothetical protein